ncbi:hypothetical protein ACLRGI_22245 [Paenarthrobacter nitroguajacolicus]|uniref:hypothetical protein n=1 Tax=Paenarthrobacter nitroguajacolicus TaxID=211146 RepID=UPI003AE8A953
MDEKSIAGNFVDSAQAVPWSVEDSMSFRLAELLLLLDEMRQYTTKVITVDRIGYFAFFASHPFVLVDRQDDQGAADRVKLNAAGFSRTQISYASIGSRYVRRRRLLQIDLEILVSYELCKITHRGFSLSEQGLELVAALMTAHAEAYRVAVRVVLKRLARISDAALTRVAREVLGSSWLLIDFTEDVRETEIVNEVKDESTK